MFVHRRVCKCMGTYVYVGTCTHVHMYVELKAEVRNLPQAFRFISDSPAIALPTLHLN